MRVRSSSELHPDEGATFVTAVPGSSFQVVGRRDPTNGELCAGDLMFTPPGKDPIRSLLEATEFLKREFPGLEIVAGDEAERFLRAVAAQELVRTGPRN